MQHQIQAEELLKILDLPAFAVSDGTIVLANDAALQRQIEIGTQVSTLLHTGSDAYQAFTDGRLHLRLCIADSIWDASVTKAGDMDIFVIENVVTDAQLRVLSLAAMQLRNPLSEMLFLTDRLLKENKSDTDALAKMKQNLLSIQRLVGNMADAPRYKNPTVFLMNTHNITAYFREIMEKAKHLLEVSGYNLKYTLPNEDIIALISAERLERAIFNILSNAVKFSPSGSTISAELKKCSDMLMFTITDQSQGLPADQSGNIFTRYLREPAIEDSRMGMGLGMMYICAAASAHGGTVLVRQVENQGLSVTLTISTKPTQQGAIRSDILHIDYAGEQDHALLELSDILASELYKN